MLMLLILMSWILSIIFIFLNHPLSLGFILLMQTIIISISSGIMNLDFWFSYILFLIMIGGLLVLFIYMTSIASNEKFKFSNKLTFFLLMSLMLSLLMSLMDNIFSMMEMTNFDLMNQSIININLSMNKFMNWPSMTILILLMIYLLITLIAVVKITQSKLGPLRQKV